MDIGNIWNGLYTSQLIGTQMYGLQSDPFSFYESYEDAWQASPWQYSLQTGGAYGSSLSQIWQNTGFTDTLNDALTKYAETRKNADSADTGMEISTHKGNVLQLGAYETLVYLPEEQKMMIVQTAADSKTTGNEGFTEKGILVDQKRARAQAAYRKTQSAKRRSSLWAAEKAGV